jgi:hypothetical protein
MSKLTTYRSLQHGAVTKIDDSAEVALGSRALDTEGNEYVYLEGVASTVDGDFVTYNKDYLTARLTTSTAPGPVAVAKAATVANKFGWYQVGGQIAAANVATHTDGQALLFRSSTAGRVTTTAATGEQIAGAVSGGNTTAANVGPAILNNPFGNIRDAT